MREIRNFMTKNHNTMGSINAKINKKEEHCCHCNNQKQDIVFDDFVINYHPYQESRPNEEAAINIFISNDSNKTDISKIVGEITTAINKIFGNKTPESEIQTKPSTEPENTTNTGTQNKPQTETPTETKKAPSNLEESLTKFGASIQSPGKLLEPWRHDVSQDPNSKVFTKEEIDKNLSSMLQSDDPVIADMAKVIKDVFDSVGVETFVEGSYQDIVLETIFAAIKGEDLDPIGPVNIVAKLVSEEEGISVSDLSSLDKNSDGSIAEELKALLTSDEFKAALNKKIQRQKNYEENERLCNDLDVKGSKTDKKITPEDIKSKFGKNEIADLFRKADGTVDTELMIVLGAELDKKGNVSYIDPGVLQWNLQRYADSDHDGKITKEEIAEFKKSEYYRVALEAYKKAYKK